MMQDPKTFISYICGLKRQNTRREDVRVRGNTREVTQTSRSLELLADGLVFSVSGEVLVVVHFWTQGKEVLRSSTIRLRLARIPVWSSKWYFRSVNLPLPAEIMSNSIFIIKTPDSHLGYPRLQFKQRYCFVSHQVKG